MATSTTTLHPRRHAIDRVRMWRQQRTRRRWAWLSALFRGWGRRS